MSTLSAQTWLPGKSTITSSNTSRSQGMSCSVASRTTCATGAVMIESLSIVRFARSSCMMPMTVFEMMTRMKRRFLYEPTISTRSASPTLRRLNSVKTFSLTIRRTDLERLSRALLTRPRPVRSWTCSAVRPVPGSVSAPASGPGAVWCCVVLVMASPRQFNSINVSDFQRVVNVPGRARAGGDAKYGSLAKKNGARDCVLARSGS